MEFISQIYSSSDVTFGILLIDVFLGLTLSLFACYIYRITFSGITYSQTFLLSLVMITVVTSVLISVIGSNLARAFSLVGALSIIRYRTAIKDARDTGFIFLCVATGMIIGAGYYVLAVSLMAFLGMVLVILDRINFAGDIVHRNVIKVGLAADKGMDECENKIQNILKKAYRQVALLEQYVDTPKKQIFLTFVASTLDSGRVKDKQRLREKNTIQEIQNLSGVQHVSVATDQFQQNI